MSSLLLSLALALITINGVLLWALVQWRRSLSASTQTKTLSKDSLECHYKSTETRLDLIQRDLEWLTTDRMLEASSKVAQTKKADKSSDVPANEMDRKPPTRRH